MSLIMSCADFPIGTFSSWSFTLAGGTGRYAILNGTWNIFHDVDCYWRGALNGATATMGPDGRGNYLIVFTSTANGPDNPLLVLGTEGLPDDGMPIVPVPPGSPPGTPTPPPPGGDPPPGEPPIGGGDSDDPPPDEPPTPPPPPPVGDPPPRPPTVINGGLCKCCGDFVGFGCDCDGCAESGGWWSEYEFELEGIAGISLLDVGPGPWNCCHLLAPGAFAAWFERAKECARILNGKYKMAWTGQNPGQPPNQCNCVWNTYGPMLTQISSGTCTCPDTIDTLRTAIAGETGFDVPFVYGPVRYCAAGLCQGGFFCAYCACPKGMIGVTAQLRVIGTCCQKYDPFTNVWVHSNQAVVIVSAGRAVTMNGDAFWKAGAVYRAFMTGDSPTFNCRDGGTLTLMPNDSADYTTYTDKNAGVKCDFSMTDNDYKDVTNFWPQTGSLAFGNVQAQSATWPSTITVRPAVGAQWVPCEVAMKMPDDNPTVGRIPDLIDTVLGPAVAKAHTHFIKPSDKTADELIGIRPTVRSGAVKPPIRSKCIYLGTIHEKQREAAVGKMCTGGFLHECEMNQGTKMSDGKTYVVPNQKAPAGCGGCNFWVAENSLDDPKGGKDCPT